MSEQSDKRNSRLIIAFFVALAVITIAATLISNLSMWQRYDAIEAEQNIAPEDAIPLPKP